MDSIRSIQARQVYYGGYGRRRYGYSRWNSWGRWVLLGVLLFVALVVLLLFSYVSPSSLSTVPYLGIRDARADEKEQMRECAPTPQAWSQAFHGHWYDHSDRTRRQCRNANVQVGWAAPNNGPVTYNNGASNGNSYKPPQQMQQQGNNSQYPSGPDQQPYYAGGGGGQASEYYNSNSAPAYDGVAQPGTYQAPSYPPPAQTR